MSNRRGEMDYVREFKEVKQGNFYCDGKFEWRNILSKWWHKSKRIPNTCQGGYGKKIEIGFGLYFFISNWKSDFWRFCVKCYIPVLQCFMGAIFSIRKIGFFSKQYSNSIFLSKYPVTRHYLPRTSRFNGFLTKKRASCDDINCLWRL